MVDPRLHGGNTAILWICEFDVFSTSLAWASLYRNRTYHTTCRMATRPLLLLVIELRQTSILDFREVEGPDTGEL